MDEPALWEEGMEQGWPCQRLRLGYGLVLFFVFEVTWGRQLPEALPFLLLGLGIALLISAYQSIRTWTLKSKIRLIQLAIEESRAAEPTPQG
jgi:hypothetical protein